MIKFSVDDYLIEVWWGKPPVIMDYYRKHSIFIDEKDLSNQGTEFYVIISKGILHPSYSIIAFSSDPIGYAGFNPGIHYEKSSDTLFIGAGTTIKTYRLFDNKKIFQKNHGFGFWGWSKHGDYIIQQEETELGVFNLKGEKLWETFVSPPYEFNIDGEDIILKFDDVIERRNLITGLKY
ncbi:MAG: hypothetical protein DI538_21615 [Azospira oryzae]|jgi:hypothetical protein|nr:MAG: hypothetical protein DI538_21615 [Azospira oryzae]